MWKRSSRSGRTSFTSFLLPTVKGASIESKKPIENQGEEKNRAKKRRKKMKPSTGSNERISGW